MPETPKISFTAYIAPQHGMLTNTKDGCTKLKLIFEQVIL